MSERMDFFNMSDDEITTIIMDTDFNLYGKFKKEEKPKLIKLFKNSDVDILGIKTNSYGNRVLTLRLWNPNKSEDIYREYTLTY